MRTCEYFILLQWFLVDFSSNLPLKSSNMHISKSLCSSGGFLFRENDVIDEGYHPGNKTCWQIHCSKHGRTLKSTIPCDKLEKHKRNTNQMNLAATSKPLASGCVFNGVQYEPGEDIQVLNDWQYDRCYGTRCNKVGEIVAWEHFNCYSTTPYTITTEDVSTTSATPLDYSSTMLPTSSDTPLHGCYDSSVFYHPGEEISYEFFNENQTCCGKYCNYNFKIVSWQSKNCQHTSPHSPTSNPATGFSSSPTKMEGCFVNGQYYEPNTKIDSANDGVRWCFGRYCNEHSRVVYWDNFNCDVTEQSTVTTTLASTVETTSNSNEETTSIKTESVRRDESLEEIDLTIKDKQYSTIFRRSKAKVKKALERFFNDFPFYRKSR